MGDLLHLERRKETRRRLTPGLNPMPSVALAPLGDSISDSSEVRSNAPGAWSTDGDIELHRGPYR
jgi:hypothetical protein